MVIGDMPPEDFSELGVLGPRGPFCMPLRTSSRPMVLSFGVLVGEFSPLIGPRAKTYGALMTVTRRMRRDGQPVSPLLSKAGHSGSKAR